MITAGFSLLKSLSKPKRKRDGDASDSPGDPDTDSASKRARARASGDKAQGAGAGASFITSSVRKTKGKTPARTPARGGGGDGVDLRARFQSVDENETKPSKPSTRAKRGEGKSLSRTANEKGGSGEKSGMMGIFSPVFAYFGGAGPGPATRARRAAAASSSAPKKDARPAEKETKQSRRTTSESRRTTSSSARASGAAASRRKDPAAATAGSRGKSRSAVSRAGGGGVQADALDTTETKSTKVEQNDDVSSSDDDVPVARLVSPGRGARPSARPAAPREESLESDEAEETESDDAVLAASRHDAAAAYGSGASGASARGTSETEHDATDARGANRGTRGVKGPSGSRVNPNLAPDGSIIQNGFGKADTTLEDEYEYEDEMDETNYDEEYDPWIFIGGLPPLRACVPKNRPRLLPPKTPVHVNKNTLVLDLDETLVHSDLEQTADRSGADFSFPVHFNNQKHVVNVKKRPFLAEFMEFAARHFEVVVFTASQRVYAERLLDTLDPDAVLVKHRLYREACVLVDGNYMKDLSVIGRDLSRVVIVDNSPQAFGFQTENGVPIESWFDDPNDAQLLKLIPLLARLAASDDVRPVLRGKFNLEARVRAAEEKAEARARAEGR
jgi:CTD small phosphatase-like protein 2